MSSFTLENHNLKCRQILDKLKFQVATYTTRNRHYCKQVVSYCGHGQSTRHY
jgi:hypothetical protein